MGIMVYEDVMQHTTAHPPPPPPFFLFMVKSRGGLNNNLYFHRSSKAKGSMDLMDQMRRASGGRS